MEIGDPTRQDKKAELVLDAITDTRTGDLLGPAETAERLADKRLGYCQVESLTGRLPR